MFGSRAAEVNEKGQKILLKNEKIAKYCHLTIKKYTGNAKIFAR